MPRSRHFSLHDIISHLPETKKKVEVLKWEKISNLLKTDSPETEDDIINNKYTSEMNLLKINQDYMDKDNLLKCLWEGALLIKGYMKANFADVYLVEGDKIYRLLHKHGCISAGACWPVGPGTIVSAYVAFTGKSLMVDFFVKDKSVYPFGTGRDIEPIHLISIPVLSENKNCMAVLEFSKLVRHMAFTEAESKLCACMVGWLGQSLSTEMGHYAQKILFFNSLLSEFCQFLNIHSNPETFISSALAILHNIVPTKKVNYYQIIEGEKMKCKVYVKGENGGWQYHPEFILQPGDLIKEVVENHTIKNLSEEDISILNESMKVQLKNIHSYLSIPIGTDAKTLGILELVNKRNSKHFDDKDIRLASRCGVYISAALHYIDKYLIKKRAYAMCENHNLTLLHQLLPCCHDLEAIKYNTANLAPPPSFFKLTYYPTHEELENLIFYTWYMFREAFDVPSQEKEINKFINFILMVKKGYRNVPYHNFEHAFTFCHCMYIITRTNGDMFSKLEKKALLAAALCHDIDHPGTTNKFLKDSEQDLAKLYNESFLENHHSSICRMLVQYCGIFSSLSAEEYQSAIKIIDFSILSTDLSTYFANRYKLMDTLTTNTFNIQNKNNKNLFIDIVMTTCDLCGQGKTYRVAERLCRNLYKEFYKEAEQNILLGIQPISVMDKAYSQKIPKYQVQFISEVCLPCFYILSIILQNIKELHTQCCEICDRWDEIVRLGISWDVFKEEYIYQP